jgi:hypothetical protein
MKWPSQSGILMEMYLFEIIKLYTTASFGFTDVTKTKKLTTEYKDIGSITKEFMVV